MSSLHIMRQGLYYMLMKLFSTICYCRLVHNGRPERVREELVRHENAPESDVNVDNT